MTVGSICSGIEAASVAWKKLPFEFNWFSEISPFPSKFLKEIYPETPNLGDMCQIPDLLKANSIKSPDIICGGTPCQAFSLAGWKKGLEDDRGNLTLKFVEIIDENDELRRKNGQDPTIVLWENVEGVLRDKTNAFGCFLASLAGFENEIPSTRWPLSGYVIGPKRNIAWRVLDAKYFGLPQQRRRLYVMAGGKDFHPENILFENADDIASPKKTSNSKLSFQKGGKKIEVFREYTDCLYSAYGTKWNGNAAAYNGSLFVSENGRLRRLTPLECERLMGFPDNYTNIPGVKPTSRYQGVGNSWAVPVIQWIGDRIHKNYKMKSNIMLNDLRIESSKIFSLGDYCVYNATNQNIANLDGVRYSTSEIPNNPTWGRMEDVIDTDAPENVFITPVGCKGILRRTQERGLSLNPRLRIILESVSSTWCEKEIEIISRKQKRGRFSTNAPEVTNSLIRMQL